jgi:hypothetical protein
MSVLELLEDVVTMVRVASVIPVIPIATTVRMPLLKLIVAISSYKFVGFTGLQSRFLLFLGFCFSCVQRRRKHFIIDALCKLWTTRRLQFIAVVPGVVGDVPGFVLGNASIIITAVGFLVLSELITASAPSGWTIPFIAVV